MRNLLLFMLLFALFMGWRNCTPFTGNWGPGVKGEGSLTNETRNLGTITGVHSGIAAEIRIEKSEENRVEISAQPNILPLIETTVTNGHLYISSLKNFHPTQDVHVNIYVKSLESLDLSGAGNAEVQGTFEGDQLEIKVSGVGDVQMPEARYRAMQCTVSGSGNVNLGGVVSQLQANVSGVGTISAFELAAQDCEVRISGSGNVDCQVNNRLHARVSGVGDVHYRGNPALDTKVSGAGSINRVDN